MAMTKTELAKQRYQIRRAAVTQARARMKAREPGMGINVMKRVVSLNPNNVRVQVREFFKEIEIPAGVGRVRNVSSKTKDAYSVAVMGLINWLQDNNMKLHSLENMSSKHVRLYFEHLEKSNASTSYLQGVNTVLRRFGVWIGKKDLCPQLVYLIQDKAKATRQQNTVIPNTLEAHGIDFEEIVKTVRINCEVTAVQMELMYHFGLRVKEVISLQPVRCDRGEELAIYMGSKGGRGRHIPITKQKQRQVLEEAKRLSKDSATGHLKVDEASSLEESVNKLYYRMRQIGFTKGQLGVTAHSFRHSFANNEYEEMSGMKTPMNSLPGAKLENKELDKEVRKKLTDALGHGRICVTSFYIGNHRSINNFHLKNLRELDHKISNHKECLELFNTVIEDLYVVGEIGQGKEIKPTSTVTCQYKPKIDVDTLSVKEYRELEKKVSEAVSSALGGVKVVATVTTATPDNAFLISGNADEIQNDELYSRERDELESYT